MKSKYSCSKCGEEKYPFIHECGYCKRPVCKYCRDYRYGCCKFEDCKKEYEKPLRCPKCFTFKEPRLMKMNDEDVLLCSDCFEDWLEDIY